MMHSSVSVEERMKGDLHVLLRSVRRIYPHATSRSRGLSAVGGKRKMLPHEITSLSLSLCARIVVVVVVVFYCTFLKISEAIVSIYFECGRASPSHLCRCVPAQPIPTRRQQRRRRCCCCKPFFEHMYVMCSLFRYDIA